MMEANDMLLWAVHRNRIGDLPQIRELRPEIEEFHLTTAEPDTAQQRGRGGDELARRRFRSVVDSHS
jgi:hypothetical protein